jgi:hypothetical protein
VIILTFSKKLYDEALKYINNETLKDYIIGLGLSAALLSDGRCGVSYTLREDTLGKCEEFFKCTGDFGNPVSKINPGMRVKEVLNIGLFSPDPLIRSVAYATLNAVFSTNEIKSMYSLGDLSQYINVNLDDTVGFIGRIDPLINLWKPKAWDILIFDRNRKGSDEILPDWAIVDLLPKCSVVVISGSAIVNGSIDWILNYVKTDKVAIVGPSTTLVPNVFPVKLLAGINVLNSDKLFKLISHGAGTKKIIAEKAVEKVVLIQ